RSATRSQYCASSLFVIPTSGQYTRSGFERRTPATSARSGGGSAAALCPRGVDPDAREEAPRDAELRREEPRADESREGDVCAADAASTAAAGSARSTRTSSGALSSRRP